MNENSAQDHSVWRSNLNALTSRHPDLARRLDGVPITPDRFIAARSADGSPILGVKLDEQKTVALAHTSEPRREADEWAAGLGEVVLKGGHVLLFGFGSGYHALSLHGLSDSETVIWITEPDFALLKAAFHLMDFSVLISSSRIRFLAGLSEEETVQALFEGPNGHRMRSQGIRLAFTGISSQLYGDSIKRLSALVEETLQFEGLKFRTSEIQGKTILNNVLANLPLVLEGAPVLRLQGACPGVPVLVIGPGPSLDEAIPLIEASQNNTILIAVDTAHRILLQHGIESDLVVSLDFTELNARHFETVESDCALLVAFPGIDPAISHKYHGRSFFFDHAGSVEYAPGATSFFNELTSLGPLGKLVSYGSTAHAACHLARMMGCSPIVLVGNDLAFPSDRWYAGGAMQNDLEQPDRETETLLDVPSNDGGTVKTSGLYKLYLDSFAELIRGTAGVVVNTSPHGARIDGCRWMPLGEVVERSISNRPLDKRFMQDALTPNLSCQRKPLIHELKNVAQECRRARKRLRRMSKQLGSLDAASPSFHHEILRRMKEFVVLIGEERRALNLCTPLCSRSSLTLMGRLGDATLFADGSTESAQALLNRLLDFLSDMDRALKLNADSIGSAAKKL